MTSPSEDTESNEQSSAIASRLTYQVDPNSGCWLFTGPIMNVRGAPAYGRFSYRGASILAHRASYELHVGPIPDGLTIDHLCRVKACINPEHLEAVSMKENLMRSNAISRVNASKTHCKHGHEFTPENTEVKPGKYGMERWCLTCRREYYERNKNRQYAQKRARMARKQAESLLDQEGG